MRVVDPFERELPASGRIPLREIESGRTLDVDTASRAVREAWKTEFEARSAELSALFVKAAVDVIELSTAHNLSAAIADPLVKYFSLRRRRKAGPA